LWATQEQKKWRLSEERKREGGDKNKKRLKGRSNGQKIKLENILLNTLWEDLSASLPKRPLSPRALWTIGVAFIGLHVSHNTHKPLISHMSSTFNRGK
jgi:hypothetical protein